MEKKYLLKNGVPVYTYKNESLHSFHISLFFKAGTIYETADEIGLTHFFEHVAIRNVNKIMGGELYTELDRRGVEFNASTYSEMVQFYTGGSPSEFTFCSSLLLKVFEPLSLDKAGLDAERKRIKAEIRENDDKNSLSGISAQKVHEGTSLEQSILGTLRGADKVTLRRLDEYREKICVLGNFFFYITGNYSDDDLRTFIGEVEEMSFKKGMQRDNTAPVSRNFFKREEHVRVKNSDTTSVRLTFDLDMSALSVTVTDLIYDYLFNGYSSPFFVKMSEEEGLFYDVNPSNERYRNIGNMAISYEVKEKDLFRSLEMSLGILKNFKERELDERDIMRSPYVKNSPIMLDDARELAFTFAYDNYVMGLGYSDVRDRAAAYAAVTPADVRHAAEKIFVKENLTVVIKGNKNRIDVAEAERLIDAYL